MYQKEFFMHGPKPRRTTKTHVARTLQSRKVEDAPRKRTTSVIHAQQTQSGWITTPNPKTMVISQTTRKTDSIICVCDKKATFIGTTFCRCGAKLTWDAVVAMIDNAKAIQHVSARKRTETPYGVAKGSSRRTGRGTARTHANILNTLLLLGSLLKKHSW